MALHPQAGQHAAKEQLINVVTEVQLPTLRLPTPTSVQFAKHW